MPKRRMSQPRTSRVALLGAAFFGVLTLAGVLALAATGRSDFAVPALALGGLLTAAPLAALGLRDGPPSDPETARNGVVLLAVGALATCAIAVLALLQLLPRPWIPLSTAVLATVIGGWFASGRATRPAPRRK